MARSGQTGKRTGEPPVTGSPGSGGAGGRAALRELAGVAEVRHRGALHVALPALLVVIGAAMHDAPVVPHDEIVHAPAVRVDELALRRVCHQLVEEPRGLVLG